jgi:hypothetical protein
MSKALIVLLAIFSLALYIGRAVVAGLVLNDTVDGRFDVSGESPITPNLIIMTLITSMVGCASSLTGLLHLKEWTPESRLVGVGVGLIACMLDFLTMGFAAKQWERGAFDGGDLEARVQFIGIAAVVQAVSQMLYVASIYMARVEKEMIDQVQEDDEDVKQEEEVDAEQAALLPTPQAEIEPVVEYDEEESEC